MSDRQSVGDLWLCVYTVAITGIYELVFYTLYLQLTMMLYKFLSVSRSPLLPLASCAPRN